ncbi:MAG: acetate--CoA ligase family protein [Anaerolineales bacterium]|nr:acetate--CoA ligase family protein [Anaerolineales bacterium]
MPRRGTFGLESLFYARSIALIGASNNPRKASNQVISTLLEKGYSGKVYPVNPNEEKVLGLRCYPAVEEIADPIDLVVISLPAEAVIPAIEGIARRGDVYGVVVLSAGFAETAIPERVALETKIIEISRLAGMRVVGPNCVGLLCTDNRLTTGFIPGLKMEKGSLGFITQSGAFGGAFLMLASDQPKPLGFNKFGHVGNMADVSNLDLLKYFGSDPEINAISMYMESAPDGRKLMTMLEDISRRKPVFVLKVGRTPIGSRATLSHTGALAGSDQVYSAAFKQAGAVRVETLEELLDASKATTMMPRPGGRHIAVLTEAGGPGIIAMDEIGRDKSLQMAHLAPETRRKLEHCLPPMAMICKPEGYVDMTASAMEKEHAEALDAILADPGVDSAVLISLPPTFLPAIDVAKAITEVIHHHQKPVAVCFMRGEAMMDARCYLEGNGIATFESPQRAARALINLTAAAGFINRSAQSLDVYRQKGPVQKRLNSAAPITEPEAVQLLAEYEIPYPAHRFTTNLREAEEAASEIGYPVVIKAVSQDIVHKSDLGGVVTAIKSGQMLRKAYRQMKAAIKEKAPDASLQGILVCKQAEDGLEVIVGVKRDPAFGPVVLFGLGGIFTEVLQDTALRIVPFSKDEALKMINETRASLLLKGSRGFPAVDVELLARLLESVSQLAIEHTEIAELDLNPVRLYQDDLIVLDVRAILA